ncbi:MAG: ribosomal-processing cysteine protease Prp [Mollicutes bacterium]|jgi:uncharacterized protein YsxB (DUF464 family)|nr:ribosomal-processing cysteine protease Prp [Mollicutes bacterium]
MIKVNYQKKDNQIKNIKINGHANYGSLGKDIVCASVSSIVITTINGILKIDNESIKYHENDSLVIENLKFDEITNKLLNNMLNLLEELESDYPKNIKIREEEQ